MHTTLLADDETDREFILYFKIVYGVRMLIYKCSRMGMATNADTEHIDNDILQLVKEANEEDTARIWRM